MKFHARGIGGWPRRDFLKLVGGTTLAALSARFPAFAGPFEGADFEQLIPADKKLAADWLASLFARGEPTVYRGAELEKIRTIVPPGMMFSVPVDVLCDVTNPLLGPTGAARTFGPQKGASPAAVERLENNLAHLADVVRRELGVDIATPAGSGAAGGLAGGAIAITVHTFIMCFLSPRATPPPRTAAETRP